VSIKYLSRAAAMCVAGCTLATASHAALVASYLRSLDGGRLGLEFALSDLPKGLAEKGVSRCQRMGMRMVFIQGTTHRMFPRMVGYAAGCWYADNGLIFIEATTLDRQEPYRTDIPQSMFKTTDDFKDWATYKRYPPMK